MTQIFISYSRRDLAFVEQLAADLQAAGLDVWYDLSGLEGGARWRIEIEKALRASQHVIMVLSPDSVISEWVEREYLFASNHKKKIIPLFYKECDLPLYYLNVHYIDVQGKNYKRNYTEILRALDVMPDAREKDVSILSRSSKERKEAPKPEPGKKAYVPHKISARTIIGVVGAVVIIVAGILVSPFITKWLSPSDVIPTGTIPATDALPVEASTETLANRTIEPFLNIQAHTGSARAVAFSPDSTKLASAGEDAIIVLWDAVSGEVLLRIEGHTEIVTSLSWSPDGSRLVSGSDGQTVRVWDSVTGTPVLEPLKGHSNFVFAVAWSHNGEWIASAGWDGQVIVWDAASGEMVSRVGIGAGVNGVAWSPGDEQLAISSTNRVLVLEPETGREIERLAGEWGDVNGLDWSPDGHHLAAAAHDGNVYVWRADDWKTPQVFQGHQNNVTDVAWSPNSRWLASVSYDQTVRIWDVQTSTQLDLQLTNQHGALTLDWSRDGKSLAGGCDKQLGIGYVEVWDVAQLGEIAVPVGETPEVVSAPTPTPLPTEITDDFEIEMVLVPAGVFIMGRDDGNDNEKPTHQVYLDSFYMDKYEVTNALYKACVDTGDCEPPTNTKNHAGDAYYEIPEFDNYPVIWVNWSMARNYCEWRNLRLPTEAEWEKAARGTDGRRYPWGTGISCDYANYSFADEAYCVGSTVEVGSYPHAASPYGAYDMVGNVFEWVADWYAQYIVPADTEIKNPQGAVTGIHHIIRGGAWNKDFKSQIVTNREFNTPSFSFYDLGFRCARDVTP